MVINFIVDGLYMLCVRCSGTGKYFGLGMMPSDCELCNKHPVSGPVAKPKEPVFIDKRSQAYRDAIKDIMAAHPDMLREEAVKLFEKSFNGTKAEVV
jgi:hypothetical protein